MNRTVFFDHVRESLFGGKLKQPQVDGCNVILDAWNHLTTFNDRYVEGAAYTLATAYHETDRTMQPIEEYGKGRGKKYGRSDPITGKKYFGRGYIQLTWKSNYAKAAKKIGVDFVNFPQKVMEPKNAAYILVVGMIEGWFRGDKKGRKTLGRYINAKGVDYIWSRDVVNGIRKGHRLPDKAEAIAGYAKAFEKAIAAQMAAPDKPKPPTKPTTPDEPKGLLTRLINAIMRVFFK